MKVAFVTPRYGVEVLGGAEFSARRIAEHLAGGDDPWPVEVFTTCALDSRTWDNQYNPGTVGVNGVTVHRFASRAGRDPDFDRFSGTVLALPRAAAPDEEQRWIDLQGPVCPDLVEAMAGSDADVVVFVPYLYYPTVRGIGRVGDRAVMHPAAHDEAALFLPLFREVFATARGFAFLTDSERRLVERTFPVASVPQVVMGLGVEASAGDPAAARDHLGLGERPYLCCVGRVDDGKGTGMLARFFAAYKTRHPGPLALALLGPVIHEPPAHPDVVVTGPVDEETKWGALRGALALVSPSAFESFSLVILEAWAAGVPVVVNAACGPTRDHCRQSRGGLWFGGYGTFEAILARLQDDPSLRATLATQGGDYVRRRFSWPAIMARYRRFLTGVAGR